MQTTPHNILSAIGNVCLLAAIFWLVIVGGLLLGAMLNPDYY